MSSTAITELLAAVEYAHSVLVGSTFEGGEFSPERAAEVPQESLTGLLMGFASAIDTINAVYDDLGAAYFSETETESVIAAARDLANVIRVSAGDRAEMFASMRVLDTTV